MERNEKWVTVQGFRLQRPEPTDHVDAAFDFVCPCGEKHTMHTKYYVANFFEQGAPLPCGHVVHVIMPWDTENKSLRQANAKLE